MDSKVALQTPRRGILHQYNSKLTAFEHTPPGSNKSALNLIIWIGGLFDGFLTTHYPTSISTALIPTTWTLAQVLLSSSYEGWGTSSLITDVLELSECVAYFRTIKTGKIVLMGHSTGCQDVMEYLTGPGDLARQPIDGGIIQAPVSDREAISFMMPKSLYDEVMTTALSLVSASKGDHVLPKFTQEGFFPAPVTANRWLSLASPSHDSVDDYFSSDLTDEQLEKSFGAIPNGTKLCILHSGSDEYVPDVVDKKALLERWMGFVRKGRGEIDERFSGIVPEASHNLNGDAEDVVAELVRRVVGFLKGLE